VSPIICANAFFVYFAFSGFDTSGEMWIAPKSSPSGIMGQLGKPADILVFNPSLRATNFIASTSCACTSVSPTGGVLGPFGFQTLTISNATGSDTPAAATFKIDFEQSDKHWSTSIPVELIPN